MFGEYLDESVVSPANKKLSTSYDGISEELDEARSETFHSVTDKLLFLMNQGRPDVDTIFY